ncbi:hypothetical protein GALL_230640 [mine drainage metagenome]|uniref:Transposase n=1 Tax=mine drainage metagenome TaxID=410659 RepID=A0A1J5RGT4_9ZZZZ
MAALGASGYTFPCAAPRESMADWLYGYVRALSFYGGVPQFIVTDFVVGNRVEHHAQRHAVEPLEGPAVATQPGGAALVPDELDVLVAATAKRHHKGPGAAHSSIGMGEHGPAPKSTCADSAEAKLRRTVTSAGSSPRS